MIHWGIKSTSRDESMKKNVCIKEFGQKPKWREKTTRVTDHRSNPCSKEKVKVCYSKSESFFKEKKNALGERKK